MSYDVVPEAPKAPASRLPVRECPNPKCKCTDVRVITKPGPNVARYNVRCVKCKAELKIRQRSANAAIFLWNQIKREVQVSEPTTEESPT